MATATAYQGLTVPTPKYVNAIDENFPNTRRVFQVEGAISGKYSFDSLPVNGNISNGNVSDSYVEFIISSSNNELVDANSFMLESKLKITKGSGADLDDACNVTVIDGLAHRLFQKSTLYFNNTPIEGNTEFGLYNALKTYLSMGHNEITGRGRNMYYKDYRESDIIDKLTTDHFKKGYATRNEESIREDCKKTLHFMTPLMFDFASAQTYLLDGIDIKIRLDLAPPSLVINSPDAERYVYALQSIKLWSTKIIPYPEALVSLNKSLTNGSTLDYIFPRPLIKSFVFPKGHSTLSVDNVFNGIVPEMMYIVFMDQENAKGGYSKNSAYFTHANVNNIRVEVNGHTIFALTGSYPEHIARMIQSTLDSVQSENNLLTVDSFKKGRTLHAFDLRASDCEDVLSIEKAGNLRFSFQCSTHITENTQIYIIGITSGLVSVNDRRNVITSYLA